MDSVGNVLWKTIIGGTGGEEPRAMIRTRDGGLAVTGWTGSFDQDIHGHADQYLDTWIVKIDSTGKILWQFCYGNNNGDHDAFSITECPDGGLATAGWIQQCIDSSHGGPIRPIYGEVIRVGPTGKFEWRKMFEGGRSAFSGIVSTSDSGFAVVGSVTVGGIDTITHGAGDLWLLKLNGAGVLQWQNVFGGSGEDIASSIIESPGEGGNAFVISGYTNSTDGDLTGHPVDHFDNLWLLRVDGTGNATWQKTVRSGLRDRPLFGSQAKLFPTSSGGFLVASSSGPTHTDSPARFGGIDAWIIDFDNTGAIRWQECYGGSGDDVAASAIPTSDGGFAFVGWTNSKDGQVTGFKGGPNDVWVAKLAPFVRAVRAEINNPNDFVTLPAINSGSGLFAYSLSKTTEVSIKIFNQLGQAVGSLIEGEQSEGKHQSSFDLTNLPSGTYYAWMTAGARETRSCTFRILK